MRTRPSLPRLLARGLLRRCPRCGSRKLFRRWLTMVAECPRCGLRFEREEGHWLGGVVINIGVTQVVVVAYVVGAIILTWPDPPVALLIVSGAVGVSVFSVLFMPSSKTTWHAIELWMRSRSPSREDLEDVDRSRLTDRDGRDGEI